MRPYSVLIGAALAGILAFGCAGCEATRKFAGLSTAALEDGRHDAVRKTVMLDQQSCYERAERSLIEAGSYIYARKRGHMLAAYVSETDTTPIGVFLSPGAGGTTVEVASPSEFMKDAVADRLFKDMEKTNGQLAEEPRIK